jgi:uncharacterized membrane protein (Fun14 family)
MIGIITDLFVFLGFGGIGGFFIGFAIKKIVKILAVLIGLYLLSLFYLVNIEVIKINPAKLLETSSSFITQIFNFLLTTTPYLAISSSFTLGFMLGIIKG